MPQQDGYAPGSPAWVDIGTDVETGPQFYAELFGWETASAGPPEATGGYGFFMKDGLMVAGYGPQQNPGPPYWSAYVAVADADETAKRVQDAGGSVVVAPMDVMSEGRMAVFQDTQGAFISVWQAGNHKGAQLFDEAGAFCWFELHARDEEKAKAFYRSVFGWEPDTHDGPMRYTEFEHGGTSVAGMMPMPPGVPDEVPSYWLVYFAVEDTDAIVARAEALGGDVRAPAMDVSAGRFAVLVDPQGAMVGVIKRPG